MMLVKASIHSVALSYLFVVVEVVVVAAAAVVVVVFAAAAVLVAVDVDSLNHFLHFAKDHFGQRFGYQILHHFQNLQSTNELV